MATDSCWKRMEMIFCKRKFRRVWPETLEKKIKVISPPSVSRVNGWSLPLHSFQLVAWGAYVYMLFVIFAVFIPLLPYMWRNVTYAVIAILFGLHFLVHIIAVTIDPADTNVRHKKNYGKIMPILDRTKHKHVIQNQYCHLCEVTVGVKAKHCSACNKCIADFDHHCKWLNNCVGSRNYWFFFTSVASAVLGILLIITVLLFIFIQYFVNPEQLRTDPHFLNYPDHTWLMFLPFFPIPTSLVVILVIGAITLLMSLGSLLLLGHLLLFHLFLLTRKLSTFDYMTQGHQKPTPNIHVKISIPEDSVSPSESGESAGQKKSSSIPRLCKKSSSEEGSYYSFRSPSFCLLFNNELSQTCFSLMTVRSTSRCLTEPQEEKQKKEEEEDKTEKKASENTTTSSEETLNQEPMKPTVEEALNQEPMKPTVGESTVVDVSIWP